ncbi:50S ribosomal protein L28 [Cryomorpha ignava]|uniref:Large ribosomal subunit protein bL28 n=1 Tax=Cryomorpha ignava TaxID=101383 RepID=A0A7K3WNY2_9FLAO|nr:50S ribosomal protein L28 [Cryomorpha ignava]NEN22572.1 50S ribosomal protein L28 [Cryomorpha ignava]
MPRICQLTGKKAMVGNNVSFSKRRTKRRFLPNLIKKNFYLPHEDKWVALTISTKALRTVNKIGIEKALKRAKEKGFFAG